MKKYNLMEANRFELHVDQLAHDAIWNGRGSVDVGNAALNTLAASIIKDGQEKPVVVMPIPQNVSLMTNQYEQETWERIIKDNPKATHFVVSGNLRFLAIRLAAASKQTDTPVVICEDRGFKSLADARVHNIAENAPDKTGQKPLSPFQISTMVIKMLTLEQRKQKEVAEMFGKSQGWVSQMKGLQNLSEGGWKALEIGYINTEAAKQLAEMTEIDQRKTLSDKLFTASEIKGRQNEIAENNAKGDPITGESSSGEPTSGNSEPRNTGSVGLKPAKGFVQWVDELLKLNNPKKVPEMAILAQVAKYFHADTQKDLISGLTKITKREGIYSGLGEGGNLITSKTTPTNGSASANASSASA